MTIRWGIAGTGLMAEMFLADFAHVPDAEVTVVGSRTTERAAQFAATHGIARGCTYADLVDADVDVVYLATPHPHHRDLALAAIASGKPVLVEKAFTATLAGAREVVDAAREAGVFCMEAMWTRLQPAVLRAKELVASGELGGLLMVQADLGAFRTYDPTHRLFDPELGGGSVLDLGVYPISLAQHFLGTPDRVSAVGTHFPNGTDASAVVTMAYDDGRAASVMCSLTSETPGRAVVAGTRGSVEIAPRFHHPTRIVVQRNGEEPVEHHLPTLGRGYALEIAHVGECLAAGLTESPVMSLDDTLGVQWVMEEALAQLGISPREGRVFR
ncbi:Gfo/Idh/MocA family oxidoreductase [Nocardioides seonyuensis]|uniref:Gfo/Idh/MocA family oxidoreductase n=1 Tax=Nocardioides seonyuensis TaxID=2518371 RepID=A0A4P7IG54_9ACTN|nr:Gfo/Idh/MocA family oxidoreductase [Nocardioides seonyuensis]QBX56294.1 Gfo/Idh/MocA family oxidoreductase [Nocardioides seonyuensis]